MRSRFFLPNRPISAWVLSVGVLCTPSFAGAQGEYRSHPPLRTAPPRSQRPLSNGLAYFVDARRGDDKNDGSQVSPWGTIRHALGRLQAGQTLYLRGGVYYETLYVSLMGRKEAPITIRSYPGEEAVIDGGLREFFETPAAAWRPYAQGGPGEYRSTRVYPNLRFVLAAFGDSMIGLVSYYHAQDLRAMGEFLELDEATRDFAPIYCGPGIWYDPATGHVHARLSATHLPGIDNYKGESDPRKLPLVIAPFRSVPLRVDGARHVRFQDLTIRGGGYDTLVLDQASDIEFDNVTVWCGSYGLRATGTQRLKFYRSALYGSIPPWLSRAESSLHSAPARGQRDIARLNTHALLVPEAGREFSIYAYPLNDDWEIAYSEFTDASDGLYLGGVSLRFHHNLVDKMQDDGLYLSPMYPRHYYLRGGATLHLYQNYFSRALTMLAFGGTDDTRDTIYFYRNVVDLRGEVNAGRPSAKSPQPAFPGGKVMGDHGSPPWPAMFTYHNTFVMRDASRDADMWVGRGGTAERPRRMFNNIFLHDGAFPQFHVADPTFAHRDGNLYWKPGLDAKAAAAYFTVYRASPAYQNSKKVYPPGFEAASLVADPKFVKAQFGRKSVNDYRLQTSSPAVDAGIALPSDWPDPLRPLDKGKPDIGALPLGAEMLKVGRAAAE